MKIIIPNGGMPGVVFYLSQVTAWSRLRCTEALTEHGKMDQRIQQMCYEMAHPLIENMYYKLRRKQRDFPKQPSFSIKLKPCDKAAFQLFYLTCALPSDPLAQTVIREIFEEIDKTR